MAQKKLSEMMRPQTSAPVPVAETFRDAPATAALNVAIDADLKRNLKLRAVSEGVALRELVTQYLRAGLDT